MDRSTFVVGGNSSIYKLRQRLFEILYLLSRHNFVNRYLVAIGAVIELLQLLQFIFPNELSSDRAIFPWSEKYSAPIKSVVSRVDAGAFENALGESGSRYLAFAFVVLLAVLLGILWRADDSSNQVGIQRVLRHLLAISSSVMYIPVVQLLLNLMLEGGSALNIILVIFALPVFIVFAFVTVVFLHEAHIHSRSLSARVNSNAEVIYLAFRTFIPIIFMLVKSPPLIGFATFALSFGTAFIFLWLVPFENSAMNRLRAALLWVFVWATVTAQVSVIWKNSEKAGPVFMFMGGSPLVACVAAVLVQIRIEYLHTYPLKKMNSPSEALVKMRVELQEILDEKQLRGKGSQDSFSRREDNIAEEEGAIGDSEKDLEKAYLLPSVYAEFQSVIKRIQLRFPNNAMMLTRVAFIMLHYIKIPFIVYDLIGHISKLSPLPDIQFMIFKMQLKVEKQLIEAKANQAIVEYNMYERHINQAMQHDLALTKAVTSFWEEVIKRHPNRAKLATVARQISSSITSADKSYQSALRIWDKSAFMLHLYAGFLNGHDKYASQATIEHADTVDKRGKHDFPTFKETLFSDDAAVLSISGESRNIGEILGVNNAVSKMFGTKLSNIVAKNVTAIIPEPFKSLHDEILRRKLSSTDRTPLNKRQNLVALHSSGYIFDIILYLKPFVSRMKTLAYLGIIEAVNPDQIQLVISSTGFILELSQTAELWFGISQDKIKSQDVSFETVVTSWPTIREEVLLHRGEEDYLLDMKTELGHATLSFSVVNFQLNEEVNCDIVRIIPSMQNRHGLESAANLQEIELMESSRESDSTSVSSDSMLSQTSRPKGEIAGAKAQSLSFNNIEKIPSLSSSELNSVSNAGNAQDQDETQTRYANAATKRERNRVVPVRKLAFVNAEKASVPTSSRTASKRALPRTVSKKGSKSQQLSSGASHASSASDTSTTVDSAETNREQKMQAREEIILLWLRRCVYLALLLLCSASIAGVIMMQILVTQHLKLHERIDRTASCSAEIANIVLGVGELEFMQRGLLPSSADREAKARRNLKKAAGDLQTKVSNELELIDSWNLGTIDAYHAVLPIVELLPLGTRIYNRTALDSIFRSVNDAFVIEQTPLTDISVSNEKVAFILRNSLGLLSDVFGEVSESLEREAAELVSSISFLQNTTIMLSLIVLVALCLFSLRPAIVSVLEDKERVLEVFSLIPVSEALSLMSPYSRRLGLLTSTADGSLDKKQLKEAGEAEKEEKLRELGRQKISNNQQQTKKIEDGDNVPKKDSHAHRRQLLTLAGKMTILMTLYLIYFVGNLVLRQSFEDQRDSFPATMFYAHRQRFLSRSSIFSIQQLMGNHAFANQESIHYAISEEDIQHQLNTTLSTMNGLIYGSSVLGIPGRLGDKAHYSLQFESLCTLDIGDVDACKSFNAGINTGGLQGVLVEFIRIERQIVEAFTAAIGANATLSPVQAFQLVNATLNGPEMAKLVQTEDRYLQPALLHFVDIEVEGMASLHSDAVLFDSLSICIFALLNAYVYFSLVKSLLRSIASEFAESRSLLKFVPIRLRRTFDEQTSTSHSQRRQNCIQRVCQKSISCCSGVASAHPMLCALFLGIISAAACFAAGLQTDFHLRKSRVLGTLMVPGAFVSGGFAIGSDSIVSLVQDSVGLMAADRRQFTIIVDAIGTSVAAIWMLLVNDAFDGNIVLFSSMSGCVGTALGMLWLNTFLTLEVVEATLVSAQVALALCVSASNIFFKVETTTKTHQQNNRAELLLFGLLGGVISSFSGSGMRTVIFLLTTLYFHVDKSVGSATAVMIAAINSSFACLVQILLLGGFDAPILSMARTVVPIVCIVAPLGAWFRSTTSEEGTMLIFGASLLSQALSVTFSIAAKGAFLVFISVSSFINWVSVAIVVLVGGAIRNSAQ